MTAAVAEHANRIIEIKDGQIVDDTGPSIRADLRARVPTHGGAERARDAAGMLEALKMALRALRANLFRTVLTLLGIVIGVGSVVAMLAIGDGAKQSVLERISAMGTNLLLVRPGAAELARRRRHRDAGRPTMPRRSRRCPMSSPRCRRLTGNVTLRYGNTDYQTQADATTERLPTARDWPVARGTLLHPQDVRSYAPVRCSARRWRRRCSPTARPDRQATSWSTTCRSRSSA